MSFNTREYIEDNIRIKDKDAKIITFKLNAPQRKLYDVLKRQHRQGKPQRAIILKARQMGFSTLTEAVIFKKTATAFNVKSGIVAHKADATNNLFGMFRLMYEELPDQIKPRTRAKNANEMIFDTKSGDGLRSSIRCMTAGGEGIGRSDTFQNLHISEYAFWPGDKKTALNGLLQAVPNKPDTLIIIESTANGYDHFKELWDMAVNGESDFVPVFCAWWEMPDYRMANTIDDITPEEKELKAAYGLDMEQLSWRRWCIQNNCGGDVQLFKQEYPSNPHEAFISTGDSIFDKEAVIAQLDKRIKPQATGHFLYDVQGDDITDITWVDSPRGCIRIYDKPQARQPYVIGGDTAGDGSDNFTAQVLDNITGKQAAVLTQATDEDLYAKQVYCLGKYYNDALIGLETNFSTYPVKTLERLQYPKLYVREREDTYTGGIIQAFGFHTTTVTRPVIIAELVQVFREAPWLISDRMTLEEMLVFVKNTRGKPEAMQGKHDDHVMALAIAYYIRTQQDMTVEALPDKAKDGLPHALITEETDDDFMEW